uniref:Uncharacterized protein n=1 Tax=Setaria italica TaxID=4555 RepID=K3ZPB6_SETIT
MVKPPWITLVATRVVGGVAARSATRCTRAGVRRTRARATRSFPVVPRAACAATTARRTCRRRRAPAATTTSAATTATGVQWRDEYLGYGH